MRVQQESQFLAWLKESGIGADPRYPNAKQLVFENTPELSRFWLPPPLPSDLPGFITTVLEIASQSGPYWFFRRCGGPWYEGENASFRDSIIDRIMAITDIPTDFNGAVCLGRDEWATVHILVNAHYVFGWNIGTDLYIVPDDRNCLLMLSHHGELAGKFPTNERLAVFVQTMGEMGFHLPDEVPDATFKVPSWMRPRDGAA